ncbi:ABC transporter permease subunit [Campylobacter sp. faydin G-105]|uniref:nickel/cobalt ABC transporter permease n=1 Tax=Campylobacter anatolicus TaxID=2829105 RepID=UPI001B9F4A77|nr:nickel/cobalt ABC transporter permease [Campylobacter anatolicus]MBR8461282.1 ABC transporter permease subunit [Campylobacter anatolicus]
MRDIVINFRKNFLTLISIFIILMVIFLGIFANFIAPNDPLTPNLANKFASFSITYPLGTDHLGRCVLSRLIYGIRTTLFLAFITIFITIFLSTIIGTLAGYFNFFGNVIMRVCDAMLAFPAELFILSIVGFLGVGIANIIIATIIAKSAWYIRMIYTFTLEYKNVNFILFSRASGISDTTIICKHILPCISKDIILLVSLDVGWVILSLSALSFLGLGVQAPTPEWGMMLNEAKNVLSVAPFQTLPSGVCILVVVLAFNFLGDSLSETLDKRRYMQIKLAK